MNWKKDKLKNLKKIDLIIIRNEKFLKKILNIQYSIKKEKHHCSLIKYIQKYFQ